MRIAKILTNRKCESIWTALAMLPLVVSGPGCDRTIPRVEGSKPGVDVKVDKDNTKVEVKRNEGKSETSVDIDAPGVDIEIKKQNGETSRKDK
jgi:hypothetical protein